jgi:1,2-diacylglycerol-3-alpha-glucose alpha-1,2-glucosyltransferase
VKVGIFLPFKDQYVGGQKTSLDTFSSLLRERGIDVAVNDYGLDFDVLHVFSPFPSLIPLVKVAQLRHIPVVFHVHSTYEDTVGSYRGDRLVASYIRAAGHQFSKMADLLITPTEYTKDTIVNEGWTEPDKVRVVSNGVDTGRFRFRRSSKVGGRAVVGSVSTVLPRKGVDFFVDAAELLPEHLFVWYGKLYPFQVYSRHDVELKEVIVNKPENTFFHGYARDLLKAYGTLDLFVSFSTVENEGIPTLEAAALGIPMVLRSIEPYMEKFEDAALFASSPEEAAERLRELVGDRRLRDRMRRRARKVAEAYDVQKCVSKLIGVYDELIE